MESVANDNNVAVGAVAAPSGSDDKVAGAQKSTKKEKKPCRLFSSGDGCKFGNKCRFAHLEPNKTPGQPDVSVAKEVLFVPPLSVDHPTLSLFYREKTCVYSQNDTAVDAYVKLQGHKAVGLKRGRVPHPLSHVMRDCAVLHVFASALEAEKDVRILSIWGAARDLKLAQLTGFNDQGSRITAQECAVSVTLGPDSTFPGDAGKTVGRTPILGKFSVVVATDIYWDGVHGAVTPTTVKRWLQHSLKNEMFVITRMFPGAAGADQVEDYTGNVEGVWYREDTGLVNFSPDGSDFGYPQHYDVNWMYNKSIEGLSVTFLCTFGPYTVLKICPDLVSVIPVSVFAQPPPLGAFAYKRIPRRGLYYWLANQVGVQPIDFPFFTETVRNWTTTEHTCLYAVSVAAQIQPIYASRPVTGHNRDTAVQMAKVLLLDNSVFTSLVKRFPVVQAPIYEGTADVACFGSKDIHAQRYLSIRSEHAEAEANLAIARAPTIAPSSRQLKKLLAILVAGAMFVHFGLSLGVHAVITVDGVPVKDSEWWGIGIVMACIVMAMMIRYLRVVRHKAEVFAAWREHRENSERMEIDESGYDPLAAGDFLPSTTARSMVSLPQAGTYELKYDHQVVTLDQLLEILDTKERVNMEKIYCIAITNALLFRPSNNEYNLLVATLSRLHCKIPEADKELWDKVWNMMKNLIPEGGNVPWTLERCAANLPPVKGAALLRAKENLDQGRVSRMKKEITCKHNETIALKVGHDGLMSIRPRPITVLNNELHVLFCRDAHGVSDLMHTIFDGKLYFGCRVWYASGLTGELLDEIGATAWAYEDYIAASGDDGAACFAHKFFGEKLFANALCPHIESDFSSMDQSQKLAALNCAGLTMAQMGVWRFVIDVMQQTCGMSYKARRNNMTIRGTAGYQLATGIDFTTVINSLSTISFLLFAYFSKENENLDVLANRLGFKVKAKYHEHANSVTFLKGWWQQTVDGHVAWYPLPSQIIKIGKIMKMPAFFSPEGDDEDGVRRVAWAIAASMAGVHPDYPLLGPFVSMLKRCGTENNSVLSASEDGWYKPNSSGLVVQRELCITAVCDRYGIALEDILRVEHLCETVNKLPVFLYDPVFDMLAEIDYY